MPDLPTALERLYRHAAGAADRGIDYLTLRRIGEVLGLTADRLPQLRGSAAAGTLAAVLSAALAGRGGAAAGSW
jgi:hypothetical protein